MGLGNTRIFFHDVTSTDKRNPTLYANGKVYGADRTGGGVLWVLDPVKNTVEPLQVQPRNTKGFSTKVDYYHDRESEEAWMASPHNPMLDEHGRVWMTEPVRPPGAENNPKWSASTIAMDTNDSAAHDIAAKALLSRSHGMQLGFYDTHTNKFVGVDTSYNTHHLQFDWQDRIWTDGDVLGELDTTKIDPANPEGTEAAAQHAWMRVDMDSKKVVPTNGYATAVSPVDGTVWLSVPVVDGPQNKLYMLDPKTNKYKDYPLPLPGASRTALISARMEWCGSRPAAATWGASIRRPANLNIGTCQDQNLPAQAWKPAAPSIPIFCGSINSIRSASARTL